MPVDSDRQRSELVNHIGWGRPDMIIVIITLLLLFDGANLIQSWFDADIDIVYTIYISALI